MNNRMNPIQGGMAEALRLTRAGHLDEATAVIQRTLGGELHKSGLGAGYDSTAEPAEGSEAEYRVLEEKPSYYDTSARSAIPGDPEPATGRITMPLLEGWKLPESKRTTEKPEITPEPPLSSVRSRGRFIDGSFTNAAGTRTYKLYIPSTYLGQQPLPLGLQRRSSFLSSILSSHKTPMSPSAGTGLKRPTSNVVQASRPLSPGSPTRS